MSNDDVKKLVADCTKDLAINLLYYDRKEDEELTMKRLLKAMRNGSVTQQFIVETFAAALAERWVEVHQQ